MAVALWHSVRTILHPLLSATPALTRASFRQQPYQQQHCYASPPLPSSSPPSCPAQTTRTMSTSSTAALRNAPGWDLTTDPFPKARRDESVIDTFKSAAEGEAQVVDPYRWLETPPNQSQETREWVEAQAAFASKYMRGYPHWNEIKSRLEATFAYPRFSCPSLKYDGNFYYTYNSGLDPQSRIFKASRQDIEAVRQEGADPKATPGKVFFNENRLSKDGSVAVAGLSFSKSGKLLCYGISKAGSDWNNLYFRSTDKPFDPPAPSDGQEVPEAAMGGTDRLPDVLTHVKFSGGTWSHDDKGVFYQKWPAPSSTNGDLGTETDVNTDARLFYHVLGTSQKDDLLICEVDPEVKTGFWSSQVTDDGKFLIISQNKNTDPVSRKFVASLEGVDLSTKEGVTSLKWICLSDKFEDDLGYLANDGNTFYFMTNRDAPRYRIIRSTIDPTKGTRIQGQRLFKLPFESTLKFEEHVEEDVEGGTLSSVSVLAHDKLLLVYSRNVMDELWQYDLKSGEKVGRLLPNFVGSIGQISGKREDRVSFIQTSGFTSPGIISRLEWSEKGGPKEQPSSSTYRETVVPGISADDFVSEQRWFKSVDGTRVPMFITYHKSTKLDGTAPAWLYSYGGFEIPLNPFFSPSLMTWTKLFGGVLVVVNARGGGEWGATWHEAGRRFNKHHTFEDVLSSAKFLHENKIAAKGKIILNGGSNGGLTVMASTNMAKEEHGIGASVAEVGVLDLLRFHLFSIGRAWVGDFGCSEDPKDFDYQLTISPLHNVDSSRSASSSTNPYPPIFLLTADHDDRVSPAHTFKMAAELQYRLSSKQAGGVAERDTGNPVLARVELDAGHGAGKSTQKKIEESTDKYAAVARALNLKIVG